jgi:hypothetical protein
VGAQDFQGKTIHRQSGALGGGAEKTFVDGILSSSQNHKRQEQDKIKKDSYRGRPSRWLLHTQDVADESSGTFLSFKGCLQS